VAAATAASAPPRPSAVLHQEGVVTTESVASRSPLGVTRPEVVHGADDRAGQPAGSICEAPRPHCQQLTDQLAAVELLDRGTARLPRCSTWTARPPSPCWMSRQGVDRLAGRLIGLAVRRHRDRLSHGDEHPPQRTCASNTGPWNERQLARASRLVSQRDAGRAALDPSDARLNLRRALR
jgi:hypothetical protein